MERRTAGPEARGASGGRAVNGRKAPEHGCIGAAAEELTGAADPACRQQVIATNPERWRRRRRRWRLNKCREMWGPICLQEMA
ncbi:hypothetical protein BX265_1719 [Streptomyces sp. TLI_235]|nr:hypothetical protein BX265_1719 [Streptomyces sp. TLI_235]